MLGKARVMGTAVPSIFSAAKAGSAVASMEAASSIERMFIVSPDVKQQKTPFGPIAWAMVERGERTRTAAISVLRRPNLRAASTPDVAEMLWRGSHRTYRSAAVSHWKRLGKSQTNSENISGAPGSSRAR